MKTIGHGIINYDITVVVPGDAPQHQQFSTELWLKILRNNIPQNKEVKFNGSDSVTSYTSNDYGCRSETLVLKHSGNTAYQYAKVLPFFNFYLDVTEVASASAENIPPIVTLHNEYKEIAGLQCRKATIETAWSLITVFYSDQYRIDDATGQVISRQGIDGFIMQHEEVPLAKNVNYFLRTTVTDFDFDVRLSAATFKIPGDYKRFANIDEVRKAERELMEREDQTYRQQNEDHNQVADKFIGDWTLQNVPDDILVHIEKEDGQKGGNKLTFTTTNLTASKPSAQQPVKEEARIWKNLLLVEDPPNYRLYELDELNETMKMQNSDIFIYRRIN